MVKTNINRHRGACELKAISNDDKRDFIEWFMSNFLFKNKECLWIMHYLFNHEDSLNNIHFVNQLPIGKKYINMSCVCSNEDAFLFCKDEVYASDAEKAFHEIRLNKDEDLYIKLNFEGDFSSIPYLSILTVLQIGESYDTVDIDEILHNALTAKRKNELKKLIDYSLDKKDKNLFLKYRNELRSLELKKDKSNF